MAAFDKLRLEEKLVALGWEVIEKPDQPWRLKPPQILWDQRPSDFYIYDARDLQELLGAWPGPQEEE
jgi:hypothetical protein